MIKCKICDSVELFSSKYRHWGWPEVSIFNNLELLTCSHCGFSFLLKEPTKDELNHFYEIDYRKISSPFYFDKNKKYSFSQVPYRSIAQIFLASIFTKWVSGDTFVDLGPGPGDSLFAARNILANPNLVAIDISDGSSNYYKNSFDCIVLENISSLKNKAKILLLSHSLEHFLTTDLDQLFSSIKDKLESDGVLVVEVPHVDLRLHENLRFPDTPHTLFFSEDSLHRLLIKNGFAIKFSQKTGTSYPYKSQLPLLLSHTTSVTLTVRIKLWLEKFGLDFLINWRRFVLCKLNGLKQFGKKENDLSFFSEFSHLNSGDAIRIVAKLQQQSES